jgi:hypothetical protein
MNTDTPEYRELVKEISLPIVTTVAPNELAHFDLLLEHYFKHPAPPDLSDSPLDVGVVFDLTPAITAAIAAVLPLILPRVLDAVKDLSVELFKMHIQRQKDKFTAAQIQQIEDVARETLKKWKVPTKKTEIIIAEIGKGLFDKPKV